MDKIKLLEEAKSNLEAEVEQLEKQMKQLEILPSDTDQLTMVHIKPPLPVYMWSSSLVCL